MRVTTINLNREPNEDKWAAAKIPLQAYVHKGKFCMEAISFYFWQKAWEKYLPPVATKDSA